MFRLAWLADSYMPFIRHGNADGAVSTAPDDDGNDNGQHIGYCKLVFDSGSMLGLIFVLLVLSSEMSGL